MELQTEILVVGENAENSVQLTQWLERRGCKCRFASSCKEACRLLSHAKFDFVLSHFELPDRSAYPILEKLIGSTTSLFFSTRIENGCLWWPALTKGKKWPAARALRPNEFAVTLGSALEDACSHNNEALHLIAADSTQYALRVKQAHPSTVEGHTARGNHLSHHVESDSDVANGRPFSQVD